MCISHSLCRKTDVEVSHKCNIRNMHWKTKKIHHCKDQNHPKAISQVGNENLKIRPEIPFTCTYISAISLYQHNEFYY